MADYQLAGALEDNILTVLCWSELHCAQLAMQVRPDLFSTRAYRDIASAAADHIERYGLPPRGHLRDLLEPKLRKGDEGKLLWKTLEAMEGLQAELQPAYVLSELDRFIQVRELSIAVELAADALHGGDLEQAREALYQQTTPASTTPGIWLHDPAQALDFLREVDEDYFSMGINTLDEHDVRPARKTLTLLVAPAKKGKSWFLINVGKAALLHRTKVLHVTLENSERLTAKRYVQAMYGMTVRPTDSLRVPLFRRDEVGRCTSIDFDLISPDMITVSSRPRIAAKLRKIRGSLLIKEFPTGTLTLAQLNAYLDYLKRVLNFGPDMLIVDYPDLMSINADNLRIDVGRMFTGLRGICVARNIAGVTVSQGNRISSAAKTVSANQVAEDYSKIGTADIILTYSQTPEEKNLNLGRILVAAARDAPDQFIVLLAQNYAAGQFALDSCYMHKQIATEISRLTGGEEDRNAD